MRISRVELEDDKTLPGRLRAWSMALNAASKASGAPTFKVDGRHSIKARLRRPGIPLGMVDFTGGEEFRVGSVVTEQRIETSEVEILVILTPVSVALVGDIVSVPLPLSEAIDVFEGLEAWVDLSVIESEKAAAKKAEEKTAVAHLPTVDETRASETWGAW